MIYLDNAATSWPKPPEVIEATAEFMRENAANPGRGGHSLSLAAARVVFACRNELAELLNVSNPGQIAFMPNATAAINAALFGLLRPGDHCVTSALEHNAVARTLAELESRGVRVTRVKCDSAGEVRADSFAAAIDSNTRLVTVTHASNVTGYRLPVEEIGTIARAAGSLMMLDVAQTVGAMELDAEVLRADIIAGPGHKSLLGPMGTGFLYVGEGIHIEPWLYGGTGSHSEDRAMPTEMPERLEAGTVNAPGLAGLLAALRWLKQRGVGRIETHERLLMQRLRQGLGSISGVKVYGSHEGSPVLSFNVGDVASTEVAAILDASFGIAVRSGLHCAPWAHESLGTMVQGTVRVSPGPFNTEGDIEALLTAVEEISSC